MWKVQKSKFTNFAHRFLFCAIFWNVFESDPNEQTHSVACSGGFKSQPCRPDGAHFSLFVVWSCLVRLVTSGIGEASCSRTSWTETRTTHNPQGNSANERLTLTSASWLTGKECFWYTFCGVPCWLLLVLKTVQKGCSFALWRRLCSSNIARRSHVRIHSWRVSMEKVCLKTERTTSCPRTLRLRAVFSTDLRTCLPCVILTHSHYSNQIKYSQNLPWGGKLGNSSDHTSRSVSIRTAVFPRCSRADLWEFFSLPAVVDSVVPSQSSQEKQFLLFLPKFSEAMLEVLFQVVRICLSFLPGFILA